MSLRSEVIRIVNELFSDSKKITELPAAGAITGADLTEIVQGGVNKKATFTQVATFTGGGGGSGTVTSFSSGNLSPLFTTSVADPTTTPALSFTLSNQSANFVFSGPTGGGAAAPTFRALVAADIPSLSSVYQPINTAWLLASGGTLTGANTITGTSTNILKAVFDSLGVTQTNGAGWWLSNTTAAAAGAQQRSPSLVWEGQGWKTDAGGASQSVKFRADVLPVQGTAAPTATWGLWGSINNAAYNTILDITSNGNTVLTTATSGTSFTCKTSTTNYFRVNETGSLFLGSTSAARIGSSTNNSSTFSISGGSITYQTDVSHYFTSSSSSSISAANAIKNQFTGSIDGTSGTNFTGKFFRLVPTYNIVTSSGMAVYDFVIEPTETSLNGTTHYGIVNSSITALNGFGTLTPTARLNVVGANNAVALLVEDDAGNDILSVGESGGAHVVGFFGVTPAARQVVPTGSSTDTVITALQNLGLFSQT